jgi:uncharacterized protein YjbI with pentapeptide repeats
MPSPTFLRRAFLRKKKLLPDSPKPVAPSPAEKAHPLDVKRLLDESAKLNRGLFVGFNVLLGTTLLACLSITDEQLLTGALSMKIPLLNITVPIWAFASVMPLLLLIVHFDLLQNLKEHYRKLQAWVAIQDEKSVAQSLLAQYSTKASGHEKALSDQLLPFIYDFAWLHANDKGPSKSNEKLLPKICWMLYCWVPSTTLAIYLIRFADLHSYFYTSWHLLLLIMDLIWIKKFWPGFGKKQKLSWLRAVMIFMSVAATLWTLSLYCLMLALPFSGASRYWLLNCIELEEKYTLPHGIPIVPRLHLSHFTLKLPQDYFRLSEALTGERDKSKLWWQTSSPMSLQSQHLEFANFDHATMPRVNFSGALLLGANFKLANLDGATLNFANLRDANLAGAKLNNASLINADLQGARLGEAELRNAKLVGAQLQHADLSPQWVQGYQDIYSELSDVNLSDTNFEGANFEGADFQRANLQGAFLVFANLDKANLNHANLQGANLSKSSLVKADLSNANFQDAILRLAKLQDAILDDPNWLGADLYKAVFSRDISH